MASVNIAITTANIGFTNMVRTEWIETETTQEGVLKTLDAHAKDILMLQTDHMAMHNELDLMPRTIDSADRWKKEQEMAYQASQMKTDHMQDKRLDKLENMHLFEHWYNRNSHGN